MSYGYGYDSVEGRAICGAVTAIMQGKRTSKAREWRRRWMLFPGYKDARCSGVFKASREG